MMRIRRGGELIAIIAMAFAVLAGCGGNSGGKPKADATFAPLQPLTATSGSATAQGTGAASPSVSGTATPSPSPTAGADAKTAAYNAALSMFDAVPAADCMPTGSIGLTAGAFIH